MARPSPPSQPAVLPDAVRRRGLLFVALATACVGASMTLQIGINQNYLTEEIHITPLQIGNLEAVRELCGITSIGLFAILAGFAEARIGVVMLLLMGLGLSAYWIAPDYAWVVGLSLVWSQGFHVWIPLPQSMTLALSEPGRAGERLGKLASFSSIGAWIGLGLAALLLFGVGLSLRPLYFLVGGLPILGAIFCLAIPGNLKTPGARIVLKRRYSLYYVLSFLDGWRKQIFTCFAGFLLVRDHGVKVQTMLILWGIVNVTNTFLSPYAGRLIDRLGERKVLPFYFGVLALVFSGYTWINNLWLLMSFFVLDSILFTFNTGITTYVNRLTPPEERTATLSMGVAMNHVAAVTMPLLGGILWQNLGYQWCFSLGVLAAVISIFVARLIPKRA